MSNILESRLFNEGFVYPEKSKPCSSFTNPIISVSCSVVKADVETSIYNYRINTIKLCCCRRKSPAAKIKPAVK